MVRRRPKVSGSQPIATKENIPPHNEMQTVFYFDGERPSTSFDQGLINKNEEVINQVQIPAAVKPENAFEDGEDGEEFVKKSVLQKEYEEKFERWKQEYLRTQQTQIAKETGEKDFQPLRPPPPPPAMPPIDWTVKTICADIPQGLLIAAAQKKLKPVAAEVDEGYEGDPSDENLLIGSKLKENSKKKDSNPIFADGNFLDKLNLRRQKAESCSAPNTDLYEEIKANKSKEAGCQKPVFLSQIKLKNSSVQNERVLEEAKTNNVFQTLKRSPSVRKESCQSISKPTETELTKAFKKRSLTNGEKDVAFPPSFLSTVNGNECGKNSNVTSLNENNDMSETTIKQEFVSTDSVSLPCLSSEMSLNTENPAKNPEISNLGGCPQTKNFEIHKTSLTGESSSCSALLEQIRRGTTLKKAPNFKMVQRQLSSIEKHLMDKVCERREHLEDSDDEIDSDNDEWEE